MSRSHLVCQHLLEAVLGLDRSRGVNAECQGVRLVGQKPAATS
jgi:hypothetical protein